MLPGIANSIDLLNGAFNNYNAHRASGASVWDSLVMTLDPAYMAIDGYSREIDDTNKGCSLGVVAADGFEAVLGVAGSVGVAAGGAGAVSALGGTAGAAGPTVTEILQAHTDAAAAAFENRSLLMSPQQAAAVGNNPGLAGAMRGNVIDKAVKKAVVNDSRLPIETTPLFKSGPDFIDATGNQWWDVTTPGQWAAHDAKYSKEYGAGTGLFTK